MSSAPFSLQGGAYQVVLKADRPLAGVPGAVITLMTEDKKLKLSFPSQLAEYIEAGDAILVTIGLAKINVIMPTDIAGMLGGNDA